MTGSEIDDLAQLTPDLASLGWTAEHEAWADRQETDAEPSGAPLIKGRLARVSRGFSVVFTGGDALMAASSSARSTVGVAPATGDFVVVSNDPEDGPTIAGIAERTSALQRRASGRVPEPQVLATNVQTVFVMHGLDRELNLRRLERQLVVAWDSGGEPVVVLTKADAVDNPADLEREARAVASGVDVVSISTVTGQNLDAIRSYLGPQQTVALMGLSGIGKSSLVNVLSDGRVQRIGEVRAADRRGRHTTVTRDLIPLPNGGLVIDAPGVREIGLWQAYEGLELAFPEIAEASSQCRFADCDHQAEPDCHVRSGQVGGLIDERRLAHWRELKAELELQDTQLEEFARRSQSRDRADAEDQRDKTRSNRKSKQRRSQGRRRRR